MPRYELSITTDYVSEWTESDALRELLQNAIDQANINEGTYSVDYDEDTEVLSISNSSSGLDRSSLLLGISSKRDNNSTIGQFGEGYKLAMTVLLRKDYSMVIYNYKNNEVWTPKVIKSRRYGGVPIVVVDIERASLLRPPKSNDLVIEVRGISKDVVDAFLDTHLITSTSKLTSDDYEDTPYGTVILDKSYRGRVYVGGLYINTESSLSYGYDLPIGSISLGRDRNLANSREVYEVTTRILLASYKVSDGDKYDIISSDMKDLADLGYIYPSDSPAYERSAELGEYLYARVVSEGTYLGSYLTDTPSLLETSRFKRVDVPYGVYKIISSTKSYIDHENRLYDTISSSAINYLDMYRYWCKNSELTTDKLDTLDMIVSGLTGTTISRVVDDNKFEDSSTDDVGSPSEWLLD